MRRSRIVVAAASGTLGIGLAAPLAAHADTTPPPGTASGTGASLSAGGQPVISISSTSAQSGAAGSSGSASGVQIGGQEVIPGGQGIQTPAGAPVSAQVDGYSSSNGTGRAQAQSSLVQASAPGGISADVLRAQSESAYDPSQSGGHSSTDGAAVQAGGQNVDLLHSEADSRSGATAYIASIDGNQFGTAQDVGKICSALSNGLLQLACVVASGGEAFVSHALVPGGPGGPNSGLNLLLLDATGAGTPGAVPAVSASSASPASVDSAAGTPATTAATIGLPVVEAGPAAAVVPAHTPGGNLPFTGAPVEFYVLLSGALLALGGVVWKLSTVVRPTLVA